MPGHVRMKRMQQLQTVTNKLKNEFEKNLFAHAQRKQQENKTKNTKV